MSQVNTELQLPATSNISLNQTAVRDLAGKPSGIISMSDLYGKSFRLPELTLVSGTAETGSSSISRTLNLGPEHPTRSIIVWVTSHDGAPAQFVLLPRLNNQVPTRTIYSRAADNRLASMLDMWDLPTGTTGTVTFTTDPSDDRFTIHVYSLRFANSNVPTWSNFLTGTHTMTNISIGAAGSVALAVSYRWLSTTPSWTGAHHRRTDSPQGTVSSATQTYSAPTPVTTISSGMTLGGYSADGIAVAVWR